LEVRLLRNGIVESRHRVHAVVCDGRGRVLMRAGDPQQLSFVRSALKPFQATVFVSSGAADHCNCGERGLAIACASHTGTAMHAREAFKLLWGAEIGPSSCNAPCPTAAKAPWSTTVPGSTPPSWPPAGN
jgi:L-asparaginase